MKKFIMVSIFIILFSQFAFSDEVYTPTFIGVYAGYNSIFSYGDNLMFGLTFRSGLSYEISGDFTLYFLFLLDMGLFVNLRKETFPTYYNYTYVGELLFGGEIKAKYKSCFFGLGVGTGVPAGVLFLRPSFGYVIRPNFLLDAFFDVDIINFVQENSNFRLGFTFYIFK